MQSINGPVGTLQDASTVSMGMNLSQVFAEQEPSYLTGLHCMLLILIVFQY